MKTVYTLQPEPFDKFLVGAEIYELLTKYCLN